MPCQNYFTQNPENVCFAIACDADKTIIREVKNEVQNKGLKMKMTKNEVVLEVLSLIDADETHGMNAEQMVDFIARGQKFSKVDKREMVEAIHAFYPSNLVDIE